MSGSTVQKAITSGQGVLLPESTRKLRKERRVTVAVNSRDRNFGNSQPPSDYRWVFPRPLKDVVSVELVNGLVPADLYNVATPWGSFTFVEDPPTRAWNVTLTPGQYTPADLAVELQARLNALIGKINTYAVGYSDITKRFTITATAGAATFGFFFASGTYKDDYDSHTGALMSINCPARLLGFDGWIDYRSAGGALVAPYRADPDFCLKRLYLHINADNSIELNRVELGAGRKDCFHVLFLDTKEGYYSLNKEMHTPIYYASPAPIARIATLNISLRDEFYRVVDLSNHDYTLMFEITYLD